MKKESIKFSNKMIQTKVKNHFKFVLTCDKNVVSFQRSLGHNDFCSAPHDPDQC